MTIMKIHTFMKIYKTGKDKKPAWNRGKFFIGAAAKAGPGFQKCMLRNLRKCLTFNEIHENLNNLTNSLKKVQNL